MWYVMQVLTGTEEEIIKQCRERLPGTLLEECFTPYYEEQKHIRQEWVTRNKVLFPGYVFVVTNDIIQLYGHLRDIEGLTKVLKTGDEIVSLSEDEIAFIREFCGDKNIVTMSVGKIEDSKLTILSGPLQGKEQYIKKIDRHKRIAFLEYPIFGKEQKFRAGLEIPIKRKSETDE